MKTKICSFILLVAVVLLGNGCCGIGPEGHSFSHGNFMGMHWQSETVVEHYDNHEFVPTIFNTRTHFDPSGQHQITEYLIDGQWTQVYPGYSQTTYAVWGNGGYSSDRGNCGNRSGPTYYNAGPNNGLPFERH